jgi:hypothetical protein
MGCRVRFIFFVWDFRLSSCLVVCIPSLLPVLLCSFSAPISLSGLYKPYMLPKFSFISSFRFSCSSLSWPISDLFFEHPYSCHPRIFARIHNFAESQSYSAVVAFRAQSSPFFFYVPLSASLSMLSSLSVSPLLLSCCAPSTHPFSVWSFIHIHHICFPFTCTQKYFFSPLMLPSSHLSPGLFPPFRLAFIHAFFHAIHGHSHAYIR